MMSRYCDLSNLFFGVHERQMKTKMVLYLYAKEESCSERNFKKECPGDFDLLFFFLRVHERQMKVTIVVLFPDNKYHNLCD